MNHAYRLVWNAVHRRYVPAPETAKGRGKQTGRSLRRSAVVMVLGSGLLSLGALAGPTGGTVSAGSGSINQNGVATTITQTSQNLAINWASFSTAAGESVKFVQPNGSAIALNRVIGNESSVLNGSLSANGQVWILNPNGVLFGSTASVNVGGLVASTLSLNDADFLAGKRSFTGDGTQGSIVNQGSLTGGYVALLGKQVSNSGTITTAGGTAAMAAGDKITLDFSGNQLLRVQVDEGTLNALVQNKGLIRSDNGTVILTASAKDALLNTVVNNEGVIEARGIDSSGGRILLLGRMGNGNSGGTVKVGGTLDASATGSHNGGFIETSGAHVQVADGAKISTLSVTGKTGTWLIDPTDFTISSGSAAQTSSGIGATTLSSNLASNNISLTTNNSTGTDSGDINVNAAVTWSANTTLTLNAYNNINVNAAITATGTSAGLALNYGGDYKVAAPITLSGTSATLALNGTSYTLIHSMADLTGVNSGLNGHYALAQDLAASGTTYTSAVVTGTFGGTFAGLGHTVSNLTISAPSTSYVGLFSTNSGAIRDLGLVGGSVSGAAVVGGLAGYNEGNISNAYTAGSVSSSFDYAGGLVGWNNGTISNAYATGNVSGGTSIVGGLVGFNNGNISFAYATGSVSGGFAVGGLVGWNFSSGTINNAYANGNVAGSLNEIGGLVGENQGTISNAYATGNVLGNAGRGYFGGLVGTNVGSISNAYATGSVSGGGYGLGGLVGVNGSSGSISNAYATGSVIGGSYYVGGLVGGNNGTINNAYWDSTTTGISSAIGTNNGTSTNVNAVTSSTAYNHSSYSNLGTWTETASGSGVWVTKDGSNTPQWVMMEGFTRPFLYSEYSTSIRNAHQLQLMSYDLGVSYTLRGNIDASATSGSNASGMWKTSGFAPVGNGTVAFSGSLDSQNHTIANLTINRSSNDSIGLIGYTGSSAVISNLGLIGGSVSGRNYVGGLVGWNNGSINNAYATGSVSGSNKSGGLVGQNDGSIDNAYATGNVVGSGDGIGGLVGWNNTGTMSNVYANGNVSGHDQVGGLVGDNENTNYNLPPVGVFVISSFNNSNSNFNRSSISNAYATGSVSGRNNVGGLVGVNINRIDHAYASGSVTGNTFVGGLVGNNANTGSDATYVIDTVYATGSVSGASYVGGLVGLNASYGSILNAYASGHVSGNSRTGGLIGHNFGSVSNAYWDSTTTGQNSGGTTGALNFYSEISPSSATKLTSSTAYNHSSYANFGTWTETATGSGVWVAKDGSNNPQWVMVEGSTRPFLYSEYSTSIRNAHQLQLMAYNLNANYNLSTNIDTTETSGMWTASGFSPVGNDTAAFSGSLDGQNHTISNLTINRSSNDNIGLFGYTGSSGVISNFGLIGGSVLGRDFVGGLAGVNNGSINNAYTTGSVSGKGSVGGLVGYSKSNSSISTAYAEGNVTGGVNAHVGGLVGRSAGTISDAHASGNVSGNGSVGGLVGENFSTISNAYATGNVTGSSSLVGGLVGRSYGSISNAHASGSVTTSGNSVGGLVGGNYGGLSNAYASGSVSGSSDVGGLAGYNDNVISNAHATGRVTSSGSSTAIGGLVGHNIGTLSNIYAIGDVSGSWHNNVLGGLVGENQGSISDAYASGNVTGGNYVGGLVGWNNGGSISNAYASGSVSSSGGVAANIGGLVGVNDAYGSISNTYASGSVSGNIVGALVGENAGSVTASFWLNSVNTRGIGLPSGTVDSFTRGLSASEATQASTYSTAGWDVATVGGSSSVWRSYEGNTMPLLRSFLTALTVTSNNTRMRLVLALPSLRV